MSAKPVLSGLGLVRGSIGLILMRIAAGILIVLPGMLVASGKATKAAQSEFFAAAPVPLPGNHFFSLLGSVTGGAMAALPVMIVIALLLKFFLDGAAMRLFALQASDMTPVRTWRTIFGQGWDYFWAMLRIAIVPGILLGAVMVAIVAVMNQYGELDKLPDSRTAYEHFLVVPAYVALGFVIWSWLVGALALHMRAVTVVTERKNTFRALWKGLGILLRRPVQATLTYIVVSAAVAVLSVLLVVKWRGEDPRGDMLAIYAALWLGAMVVQAFAWHWLAHSAVLLSVSRQEERGGEAAE